MCHRRTGDCHSRSGEVARRASPGRPRRLGLEDHRVSRDLARDLRVLASRPVSRSDFYTIIHKHLRRSLFELSIQLGGLDRTNAAARVERGLTAARDSLTPAQVAALQQALGLG